MVTQVAAQVWKTRTWMTCLCLEPCLGQPQTSWTGIDYPARAAVGAGLAPWQWTVRTATRQVCPRTQTGVPSAGRQALMMSASSPEMGRIFWEGLLQEGTGASVPPAMGPCLPCGKAITQACLGLCPGKAEGEVSANNSWNSFLAFTELWKRKRVAFDGSHCPLGLSHFTIISGLHQISSTQLSGKVQKDCKTDIPFHSNGDLYLKFYDIVFDFWIIFQPEQFKF